MKKKLLLFGILAISLSAYIILIKLQKKTENSQIEQKKNIEKSIENKAEKAQIQETELKNKISINQELKKEYGGKYMVSINPDTTILSLLNYKHLFNPLGKNLDQELSHYIKETDTNKISYKKGKTIITLNYYKNEMYGNTEHFMKGIFLDKEIDLLNDIHIGMSKKDFLQGFFNLKKSQIQKTKQVSIDEDERGEMKTQYRFDNGKLVAISFGNYEEYKLLNIENLSIPKWVTKTYSNENSEVNQKIDVFEKINDSISYVIVEQSSGVGSEQFLDTYKYQNKIDRLKLLSQIDADLGRTEYSYTEYEIRNGKYIVSEIIEKAIDKENQLLNEKALDEVETKIDTIIKIYEINNNGNIVKK